MKINEFNSTPNPTPKLFEGGDCGACVLSGVTGKTVAEVYEDKGEIYPFTIFQMIDTLKKYSIEYNNQLPKWDHSWTTSIMEQFGFPAVHNSINWWERHVEFIDKGWIAIAQINHKGLGKQEYQTDHWVLLIGYEKEYVDLNHPDLPKGCKRIDNYVHISCSMNGGSRYRLEVQDLLSNYGAYNSIYIKPN